MNFTFRVILCALVLALTTTSIIAQARIITSDDINMTDYENVMQEDDGTADTTTQAPVPAVPATSAPAASVTKQEPIIATTPQAPAKSKKHPSAGSSSSGHTQAGFCITCANVGKSGGTSAPSVGASLAPVVQLSTNAIELELTEIGDSPISQSIADQGELVRPAISHAMCWHGVKNILYDAKVAKTWSLGGEIATSAVSVLKSKNFVNLMDPGQPLNQLPNPCLAPPGAVLVYSGGPLSDDQRSICSRIHCGHVEVKTGPVGALGFASDYRARNGLPVTGSCSATSPRRDGSSGFRLQAILVAPGTIPQDDLAVRTASNPQD